MWNATAEVDRSRSLGTNAERAAAFLCTAGPWALMPGASHAFIVADSPSGLGRLICLVGCPPDGVVGGILEVVDQAPGQMIEVQSRSTDPVGKRVVTLSAIPYRDCVRVRLRIRVACGLPERTVVENTWRRRLDTWLSALADTLEGRSELPSDDMPAAVQRSWRDGSRLTEHEAVRADAFILAPPRAVWEAVRSPATQCQLRNAVYGGYVPGTTERQVGEMSYQVMPHQDGQLAAAISFVAEIAEEQWVLTRRIGRPHGEFLTSLQAAADGTTISLTSRVPESTSNEVLDRVAADLTSRLGAYKGLRDSAA